jgi:hypothetical protein
MSQILESFNQFSLYSRKTHRFRAIAALMRFASIPISRNIPVGGT